MIITAKYDGTCRRCGESITAGEKIEWERGNGATHYKCPELPQDDSLIEICGGSGYGCRGYVPGQIIKNLPQKVEAGEPEYLTVVSVSQQYYRDDGLSVGVGEDSGYMYFARCRPATREEAAKSKARREAAAKKKQAHKMRDELAAEIRSGEYPEGSYEPEGEMMLESRPEARIYGGGSWFVVGDDWTWYVQNNGADGDDWSRRSNVRTSGAGAVGWRVPTTDSLRAKIKNILKNY